MMRCPICLNYVHQCGKTAPCVPLEARTAHGEWQARAEAAETQLTASKSRVGELEEALKEAREMVMSWAAYAGDYFREKHSLADDVARLDTAIAKASLTQTSPNQGGEGHE